MRGLLLRKALAVLLCLAVPAGAIEVRVPIEGKPSVGGGQAGAAGAVNPGGSPLTTTLGLNVDLAGSIRSLPGAPQLSIAAQQTMLAPAAARLPAQAAAPAAAPTHAQIMAAINPPAGYALHEPDRPVFWPPNVQAFLHEPPDKLNPRTFAGIAAAYQRAQASGLFARRPDGGAALGNTQALLEAVADGELSREEAYEGAAVAPGTAAGEARDVATRLRAALGLKPARRHVGPDLAALRGREEPPAPLPAFLRGPVERHIVFDVRGSRGGHGDVAAGYLTAFDLIDRLRPGDAAPRISFIADQTELRILSRLTGETISSGSGLFGGRATAYSAQDIPRELPPASVLMVLADAAGEFTRHGNLRWVDSADPEKGYIPATRDTVIMTQTVFGNTEITVPRNATVLHGRNRLELSHAGIREGHAGVYTDPVGRALRGRSREQVRAFALDEARKASGRGAERVTAFLQGEALSGAEPGLAYGITAKEVKSQFERYLKGLAARARKGASYALFTPSGFSRDDVKDGSLRKRIVVIEDGDPMPAAAQPGRIYVVKTGTLPHPLFVSLMAYARPPPVLAGDGAMSAALSLGRPYVMTEVAWNRRNILDYGARLSKAALSAPQRRLFARVYGKQALEHALELEEHAPLFDKVSRDIPTLTDSLFEAAEAAHGVSATGMPVREVMASVGDDVLRDYVVALRSVTGDEDARLLAWQRLRDSDSLARRRQAAAVVRCAVLYSIFPQSIARWLLAPDRTLHIWNLTALNLPVIGSVAARLALYSAGLANRRRAREAPVPTQPR